MTSSAPVSAIRTRRLSSVEAAGRLRTIGRNRIVARAELTRCRVSVKQFRNPLLAILIFAAAASGASGEWIDALVVLTVVVATVAVGFWRRTRRRRPRPRSRPAFGPSRCVVRDGQPIDIPSEHLVPGDVVLLSAGDLISPGTDC